MELAGILTGLLLIVGGAVALAGVTLHVWLNGHRELLEAATHRAGELTARLAVLLRLQEPRRLEGRERLAGQDRGRGISGPDPAGSLVVLTLVLGLAAVALTAVGLGTLVDNVTDGDGVVMLDHPAARFVGEHRTAVLTSMMKAASAAGGPAGVTVCALTVGVLLAAAWRSWTPAVVLATTVAGAIGLTVVFKAALAQPRPPLGEAVAAADGYGFPSGHAAAAAAVCGAVAWLCSIRMRSCRARIGAWAVAAMLAALVGFSRVYLGVHWVTDVLGGWVFGILWLAVVVSGWAGITGLRSGQR